MRKDAEDDPNRDQHHRRYAFANITDQDHGGKGLVSTADLGELLVGIEQRIGCRGIIPPGFYEGVRVHFESFISSLWAFFARLSFTPTSDPEIPRDLGHLAIAQVVQIEQNKRGVGRGQLVDRGMKLVDLIPLGHLLGAVPFLNRRIVAGEVWLLADPAAAFSAMPAERRVQSHRVAPGGRADFALKAREGTSEMEEDLLNQIPPIIGRQGISAGHLEDGTVVGGQPGLE